MVSVARRRGLTLIEVIAALALMAGVLTAALIARSRLVEQAQRAEVRQEAVELLISLDQAEGDESDTGSFYADKFFVVVHDREPPSLEALGLKVRRTSVYRADRRDVPALAYVDRFVARPAERTAEGGLR